MSRKLVLVSVFLIVLPAMVVALRAQSVDPPQKAGGTPAPQKEPNDARNLFGDPDPFGAGPDESKPAKPKINAPKADESKPSRKSKSSSRSRTPGRSCRAARKRSSRP